LRFRDIEELLLKRGVVVSCESIRRWCDKFGSQFARQVKITERQASEQHLASGRNVRALAW